MKMRSYSTPKQLYRRIEKGEKIDKKFKLKWIIRGLTYMDFEWRVMVYVNKKTLNNLEVYHIDRMNDYKEMYWVFISDKNKNFLDWYWKEQK